MLHSKDVLKIKERALETILREENTTGAFLLRLILNFLVGKEKQKQKPDKPLLKGEDYFAWPRMRKLTILQQYTIHAEKNLSL